MTLIFPNMLEQPQYTFGIFLAKCNKYLSGESDCVVNVLLVSREQQFSHLMVAYISPSFSFSSAFNQH
jgi:hypothetical protein